MPHSDAPGRSALEARRRRVAGALRRGIVPEILTRRNLPEAIEVYVERALVAEATALRPRQPQGTSGARWREARTSARADLQARADVVRLRNNIRRTGRKAGSPVLPDSGSAEYIRRCYAGEGPFRWVAFRRLTATRPTVGWPRDFHGGRTVVPRLSGSPRAVAFQGLRRGFLARERQRARFGLALN